MRSVLPSLLKSPANKNSGPRLPLEVEKVPSPLPKKINPAEARSGLPSPLKSPTINECRPDCGMLVEPGTVYGAANAGVVVLPVLSEIATEEGAPGAIPEVTVATSRKPSRLKSATTTFSAVE